MRASDEIHCKYIAPMKLLALALALILASTNALMLNQPSTTLLHRLRGGAPKMASADAIAIVVDAEIDPSRVDEFLKVIEEDAKGSRDEPGCLRFDVIRASETRFFFYEAYTSAAAVDEHKAQPHFKLWSDFKASGGVVSSVSTKGAFLGDWSFQQ